MTFSIHSARRSPVVGGAKAQPKERREDVDGAAEASAANLPVPVSPPRTIQPQGPVASAAIEAQMLGERRGLRAGSSVIDQAKVSYTRTEWSGSKDRRAPKGRAARTEI